jgi:hypothetical protein
MKRSPVPLKTATLSDSAQQHLNRYALAATAGGVSLLALVLPSEAKIVYTPTHRTITNGKLPIPIAGTRYFTLTDQFSSQFSYTRQLLDINAGGGAEVVVQTSSASALMAGQVVGPADRFRNGKNQMVDAFCDVSVGASSVLGPFANTVNRFLGLKFNLNGQVHYGWARFSKVTASACNGGVAISATLTGYAYETIPNKSIKAGQTKGPDHDSSIATPVASLTAPSRQPATLGMLALGARTLSIWRREESVGARAEAN